MSDPAGATCPTSQAAGHLEGGYFQGCTDSSPVFGYIYEWGNKAVNSNGIDVICETNDGLSGQGNMCLGGSGNGLAPV
jgi:hypothetical protein